MYLNKRSWLNLTTFFVFWSLVTKSISLTLKALKVCWPVGISSRLLSNTSDTAFILLPRTVSPGGDGLLTVNCKENHSKRLLRVYKCWTVSCYNNDSSYWEVLRKFAFDIKQFNFQFTALEDIYVTPSDQWQSFLETLGKILRDVDGPPALIAEIHRYPLRTF